MDILESKEAYLIRAELPGMKKEDFNLEVNDGTLTLSGERKSEGLTNGVEHPPNRAGAWQVFAIFLSAADRQAGRYQGHLS